MKRKKEKKIAKKIMEQMEDGALPESVAFSFKMTLKSFNEMIESSEYLKEQYEIAFLGLQTHYQIKLRQLMDDPYANRDAIKIYYSHYLNVMEKKPLETGGVQNSETWAAIIERMPS